MPQLQSALLSVSDKTGLVPFASFLAKQGVRLYSTGGTAKALREAGLAVTDVSDLTGFPEIMDGRVKTLHPKVHGGLLARRQDAAHVKAMAEHGIAPIDMVVVNLYPFTQTVASGAAFDECIEQIDIGGPSMLRSAAKNHQDVLVVVDSGDYAAVQTALETDAADTALRRRLAHKAFAHTAAYDAAISSWLAEQRGEAFPETLVFSARRQEVLRYGENPHQQAAFYATGTEATGMAALRQLQGKALSYNNLNDTDAALALVAEFAQPAAVVIKHANPCGVGMGATAAEAFQRALAGDKQSAFGGIVALNRPLDKETAEAIAPIFMEVVVAPEVSEEAREALAKKKNLRLLEAPAPAVPGWQLRSVAGGLLLQDQDVKPIDRQGLQAVSGQQPDEAALEELCFAFTVCKHVKSNAIVLVKDGATIGIGAGQMSRVDAVRFAIAKAEAAGHDTRGAVLASDAFFPFADNIEEAAGAGIGAVIQPGGSVRDDEVIAAAKEAGMTMVFTGQRHFRH